MRRFDDESTVLQGSRDEYKIISERAGHGFIVMVDRHPTLGRLVTVSPAGGTGVMAETKE